MFGKILFLGCLTALTLCLARVRTADSPGTPAARRAEAARQLALGNYKNAGQSYRALVLDPTNDPQQVPEDLQKAFLCLSHLDQTAEMESFLRDAEKTWGKSWRVLTALARQWTQMPHLVHRVEGTYVRSPYWVGEMKFAGERDRATALGLLHRAEAFLDSPDDPASDGEKQEFYQTIADTLLFSRERTAWRLSSLTDIDTLPDYQDYGEFYGGDNLAAPVDQDGSPLFYPVPASWETAKNDGERWRWALDRMSAFGNGEYAARWELARFLNGQFGVHTLGRNFAVPAESEAEAGTGAFAVRTLSENETIARLATGVKRFSLPDEYNFISLLRGLSTASSGSYRNRANVLLAQIFENRQQFAKAVSFWEKITVEPEGGDVKQARDAILRITGNNGMLEAGAVSPAGVKPVVPYLFRNGKSVSLTAHRLEQAKLLADIRATLKEGKEKGEHYLYRPEMIGRFIVEQNKTQYLGDKVAEWQVALEPAAGHYSTRTRLEMPFTEAGCYLVEAAMADGNTSRVIVLVADLSIAAKTTDNHRIVYLADAVTGEPVSGATVTFFGFSTRYVPDTNRRETITDEFAEKTGDNGLIILDSKRFQSEQWLTIAHTDDGRFAYSGFDWIGHSSYQTQRPERESAFVITDRPVYRPDQAVNFKVWIGTPSYSEKTSPNRSGRAVTVIVRNPMGEEIYQKALTTGIYGDVADSLTLDANAPLGGYFISVSGISGGVGFRLEEYKKPEFEVTVETPDKALPLGEKTEVVIRAGYYYGAPVINATVKYKVLRSQFASEWFPPWRWDWLYGAGCWWSSYTYDWFPGWDNWGIAPPLPPWFPRSSYQQPELVAEGEGALDADGVFRLPLDTAPAKELFGHQDHEYTITVEVTDQSRRVIMGDGKVVASRKPFAVTVWSDRGYYQVGQDANIRLMARLPLGSGVQAKGRAVLYRVRYDSSGAPSETEVQSWDLATDDAGAGSLRLQADRPGQYRLSCTLSDDQGNNVEGATVMTFRGEADQGDFRFAALELVPDQREYQPGDTVRLAVNSENKKAVVLFLPRAERNGNADSAKIAEAPEPALLRLENGSHIVDIPVGRADQPNFFCEAVTIFDGKIHLETREIFVPPSDKTLTVQVTSDKKDYLPGQKAGFEIVVTDTDGKPVAGQCVVTVYDRSVDYISGGSNIADIRAHFWKWKRDYQPSVICTLDKHGYRVMKKGDVQWEPLGIFGRQEADWNDDMEYLNGAMPRQVLRSKRSQSGYMPEPEVLMEAAPMAAMPPPSPAAAGAMYSMDTSVGQASFEQDAGSGGGAVVEPTLREEFADTALWIAALETDADGRASFEVTMPENLTAWKTRAWVMAEGVRVGESEQTVETRKNVVVRPQMPRFLTQKDQVVLSANLHNYLPRAKTARVELALEGGILEPAEGVSLDKAVELAANGEARVDWLVNAVRPGEARIIMRLLTDEESDAAAQTIPVVVHGARRVENFGGVLRDGEKETVIRFRVPEERLPGQSRLELSFSPTIAASMMEALPFLIEYPYGCTEQTLNRFLPVVVTRKFLDNLGVDLSAARKMLDDAPTDAQSDAWKATFGDPQKKRRAKAVFDDRELEAMAKQGLDRLATMQNSDGGWGWFSGQGERSWPHTTAVVVYGLLAAKANGQAVSPMILDQGIDWLVRYRTRELKKIREYVVSEGKIGKSKADNLDAFIQMILTEQGKSDSEMRELLYRDRLDLSLTGMAMLGLSLQQEASSQYLAVVLENLEQYLEENREIGTAWLKTPSRGWWWWYNSAVETQAWYLRLLSRTDPKGPRAGAVARHLLRNRKNGSYWQSTRDTAYAIEALADYAVRSGEAKPEMTVAVFLDGKRVMERKLSSSNILEDNRFILEGTAVETGDHELRIVRTGSGNVYYGGGLDLFSLEDPIAKTGLELKVERAYYRLIPEEKTADRRTATGVAAAVRVEKYRRERMSTPFDADPTAKVELRPGDLVEVELTVEAANDYEYLVFEDMKAAGLEAVELHSGYTGNSLGAYVEYRDQKVVLFVRHLPQGKYSVTYRLRAEVPGWFSALPTFAGGMYATDLFANSDEMKVRVVEEGVFDPASGK